jgi:GT2 family glycosyltransferase
MTAGPEVSVVVPHYRDLDSLDACLRALAAQTYSGSVEIIVADNASPEGEDAVARVIDGRARLIVAHERGAGPARNAGASAAMGAVLAFTDCDCRPEPGWLAAGLQALSRHDVVGGRVTVLVEDPDHMTASEAFEAVFAFDNEAYVTRKGFTVTANLFCARAVFERVGGFGVGMSEDVDWCRRATAAGYGLGYAPDAVVGHPARRTWKELLSKGRRINAETFALYAREPYGRPLWLARTMVLPASALIHAPRVLTSKRLPRVADRAGALAMLFRLRGWRFWDSLRLLFRTAKA